MDSESGFQTTSKKLEETLFEKRSKQTNNLKSSLRMDKTGRLGLIHAMAKFLEAQFPANNNCPECVDISMYAPAKDWCGTTKAGT